MANIASKRFLCSHWRTNGSLILRRKAEPNKGLTRKSHDYLGYREWNYEPNRPYLQRVMHINAGFMWCYIFWSFRHNWRELVGEYIWPDKSRWSDQHLGIPADDED